MLIKKVGLVLLLIFFCSCTSTQKIKREKENIEIINDYLNTIKDTVAILKSENIFEIYGDSLMLLDNYNVLFDLQNKNLSYTETFRKRKIQNPKFNVVSNKEFFFTTGQLDFSETAKISHKFKVEHFKYFNDMNKLELNVSYVRYHKKTGQPFHNETYEARIFYEKVNGKWQREKNPRANLKPVILPNGALRME